MTLVQLASPVADGSLEDILGGLTADRKVISSKYLYDATGSNLFEEICGLPEYHVTRTELALLDRIVEPISTFIPRHSRLIEFGSGASVKTARLLQAARQIDAYVPVDISATALEDAAGNLRRTFPRLQIEPIVADFTSALPLPAWAGQGQGQGQGQGPDVGFFPGSTIGNFDTAEARRFLSRARVLLGDDARFILGADVTRDPALLIPAYDDAAGVTAAFNLNLLARFNREFGANFDLSSFAHRALWNEPLSRVEMHLVSQCEQTVRMGGKSIAFAKGETIHTESSHKYDRAMLEALAAAAGWRVTAAWEGSDPTPPVGAADPAAFCILLLDAR